MVKNNKNVQKNAKELSGIPAEKIQEQIEVVKNDVERKFGKQKINLENANGEDDDK